ncbi:MAG: hypothetical protein L3J97_02980, partial [Thermoplasmata archaeon]|nr:hypothetical protein [Thermoplasmata archaeon]
ITSETGYKLELPQIGYSIDGKSSIPRFIFAKAYRADMHVDDLSTLVAQTIAETNRVDNDVGPTVKIVVIDRSGQRELDRLEVEEKIERSEPFVGLVRGVAGVAEIQLLDRTTRKDSPKLPGRRK